VLLASVESSANSSSSRRAAVELGGASGTSLRVRDASAAGRAFLFPDVAEAMALAGMLMFTDASSSD